MEIKAPPLVQADFSDVDQMCEEVRTWDLDFRPLVASAGRGTLSGVAQLRSGPAEFGQVWCQTHLEQRGAPPVGKLTVVVPKAGLERLWCRGHDISANMLMIIPVGGELLSFSGPDFDIHTISVDTETLASIADDLGLALPNRAFEREVTTPPQCLLDSVRIRLRRLGSLPPARRTAETRLILEDLVLAWCPRPDDRPLPLPSLRSRDRAVQRSLEALDSDAWIDLSPGQLCRLAKVSERTLQYAFRERFGQTPAAFLKARRLAAVRGMLVASNRPDVTVTSAAVRFGFLHFGQFSVDYRRAFGETPSATLEMQRPLGRGLVAPSGA